MLRVRVPFFALYILFNKMNPKAVFGISNNFNYMISGIINRIDILFYYNIICDYRLIGKSFIFQVNIVGSSPTNHIKEKWLSG